MLKIASLLAAFLLALPAFAHEDWIVRTDAGDDGTVVQIDPADVVVAPNGTTDWSDPIFGCRSFSCYRRLDDAQGNTFGAHFAGQTQSCITYPGGTQNGKIDGLPTAPLQSVTEGVFSAVNYSWITIGGYRKGSSAWSVGAGCPEGSAAKALGGWSYKFNEPRTAMRMEVAFRYDSPVCHFDRVHFEFYDEFGNKVGHRDLTGTTQDCRLVKLAFASTTPIAGFTTWTQNGRGPVFFIVEAGEMDAAPPPPPNPVPLTLEERVCRLENHVGIGCE